MVVRRTRLQPSRTEPGGGRATAQDVARHVRRPDPRPCHRIGQTAAAFSTALHAEDILCGLRFGSRRSSFENGCAILVRQRKREKEQLRNHPFRISRRHMECDVRMRPGDRHALPVWPVIACTPLCSATLLAVQRRMESGRPPPSERNNRTAPRRIGRTYPRTHRTRCRRHVVLSPAVSA